MRVCRWPLPARQQQQEPGDPGSGADLSQRSVVPCGCDRCADRWRPHPGPAHHAGVTDAAQREQAAAGPAAADAVAAPLQLPRPPHQEGTRGQAGPGVHGTCDGPRELLSDLRQDEAGWPRQRQDPVSGALGDVQWPRQAGVCMTSSCWELNDWHLQETARTASQLLALALLYFKKTFPHFFVLWVVFQFVCFFKHQRKNTRLISCLVVFARGALYLKMKGEATRSCI